MNKNLYEDPSLIKDEDKKKTGADKTIPKETLKKVWLEFRSKILSPTNLITFIVLALIFYSLMIYKDVVDVPQSIKFMPYLLLLGAMLSSYKTGKLNWSRITTWFTVGVIAIFIYGTFNELEKTRSMGKKEIGQKVYNGLVDRLTKKAEAKILPRQIQEKIVHFKPNQPTNSHLTVQPGDAVWYINPTAPFKVPGQNQFHTIVTITKHEATGFGDVVIYGDKKEGYVQIKTIPKNS